MLLFILGCMLFLWFLKKCRDIYLLCLLKVPLFRLLKKGLLVCTNCSFTHASLLDNKTVWMQNMLLAGLVAMLLDGIKKESTNKMSLCSQLKIGPFKYYKLLHIFNCFTACLQNYVIHKKRFLNSE